MFFDKTSESAAMRYDMYVAMRFQIDRSVTHFAQNVKHVQFKRLKARLKMLERYKKTMLTQVMLECS